MSAYDKDIQERRTDPTWPAVTFASSTDRTDTRRDVTTQRKEKHSSDVVGRVRHAGSCAACHSSTTQLKLRRSRHRTRFRATQRPEPPWRTL
jgi:hypothetical protein